MIDSLFYELVAMMKLFISHILDIFWTDADLIWINIHQPLISSGNFPIYLSNTISIKNGFPVEWWESFSFHLKKTINYLVSGFHFHSQFIFKNSCFLFIFYLSESFPIEPLFLRFHYYTILSQLMGREEMLLPRGSVRIRKKKDENYFLFLQFGQRQNIFLKSQHRC